MPRAVGLDFGTRLLKLVELSGSAKSVKVQRVVIDPVAEGTAEEAEAARVEQLRRLFHEHRLPKDDVCAAFEAGTTVFRDVTVPFHEDDQIEKVVRFEAENHLHGRAIEDVVVNWIKTGDTRDGSQLIILAAPKAELSARLERMHKAGIEPASVDLDATAVFTACHVAGVFEENPAVVILEIGARTTSFVLVENGSLRSIRTFLVGTESIGTALQHDLSLPAGDASARALRSEGPDPEALLVPATALAPGGKETAKGVAELEQDVVTQRREEFLRKLQRETLRSLASARTAMPPTKVLITGGGSTLPGLAATLSERLGLPVEPLRLLPRFGWESEAKDPDFEDAASTVAVGCALRLLGADPLGIELRRDEFAPSNTFEVVRGVLAVAVTLLVAVLAGLAFVTKERADREAFLFLRSANGPCTKAATIFQDVEERYLQDVKGKSQVQAKDIAKATRQAIPNDANYLYAVRSHLLRRYRELEENLGLSKEIPPIHSALKVWTEIWKALGQPERPDLGWFRVYRLVITQQAATLTVEVQEKGRIDRVMAALNASEYLKSRAKDPGRPPAQLGNVSENPQKRSTASIEIPFADDTR